LVLFSGGLLESRPQALVVSALPPFAILCAVLVAPAPLRRGLVVFRRARLGLAATCAQLGAWALQWLACYVLLVALRLDGAAGMGAAAAVLLAVNVTAVLPVTPSNLGVFQAACVAVLCGGYGIGAAQALGYGIVLQAVEFATAMAMGAPALVSEGLSWRELRIRRRLPRCFAA